MPDRSEHQLFNGNQHAAGDIVYKKWCELHMLVKLDSMYLLTEWQFHNPLRLRSIMKDDDEAACWVRLSASILPWYLFPSASLAACWTHRQGCPRKLLLVYWRYGAELEYIIAGLLHPWLCVGGAVVNAADRLWIQRPLQEIFTTTRKRRKQDRTGATKRVAGNPKSNGHGLSGGMKEAAKGNGFPTLPPSDPLLFKNSGRGNRVAKTRANLRMISAKPRHQSQTLMNRDVQFRPLGTRVSSRLRSDVTPDGWQSVPREWLAGGDVVGNYPNWRTNMAGATATVYNDLDSVSDLTELSSSDDQDTNRVEPGPSSANGTQNSTVNDRHPVAERSPDECEHTSTDNVIEWETVRISHSVVGFVDLRGRKICITRYDWEQIGKRFEHASHPSERKLHKVLVQDIVPLVIEGLKVWINSLFSNHSDNTLSRRLSASNT